VVVELKSMSRATMNVEIHAKIEPECAFFDWSGLKSGSSFFLTSSTTKMDSALSSSQIHTCVSGKSA
jgi:hypothetical protein